MSKSLKREMHKKTNPNQRDRNGARSGYRGAMVDHGWTMGGCMDGCKDGRMGGHMAESGSVKALPQSLALRSNISSETGIKW